jgi:hypothetical protein
MNAAFCLVAGSIGICQNPEAKSTTEKTVAFAAPIASNTHSRRGKIQQLTSFLHNQKHVFDTNLKELGVARNYHHQIKTDESPLIKMPFYRQPPHLQKETERQIEEMLENNIITPSTSAWFFPVILVRKQCGTYRFAVDYTKLNKITKLVYFPLPRLEVNSFIFQITENMVNTL